MYSNIKPRNHPDWIIAIYMLMHVAWWGNDAFPQLGVSRYWWGAQGRFLAGEKNCCFGKHCLVTKLTLEANWSDCKTDTCQTQPINVPTCGEEEYDRPIRLDIHPGRIFPDIQVENQTLTWATFLRKNGNGLILVAISDQALDNADAVQYDLSAPKEPLPRQPLFVKWSHRDFFRNWFQYTLQVTRKWRFRKPPLNCLLTEGICSLTIRWTIMTPPVQQVQWNSIGFIWHNDHPSQADPVSRAAT